ncbi:Pre-mRNA-splicing factor [Hirschfeldia incana]|nr:Pre-mRNA-splicing factor [Hirschfeldia incana]
MDTELNSPPNDGDASFKKPSNDGSGRKYRRRALADDGSSSSDGSPERDHIPNPKHSREDVRKVSESVHSKKEDRPESDDRSRRGRGGVDSHRHDRHSRDDHYRSKRDEYYRHERDAPRSSRDSRGDRRRAETEEHSRSRNDSDRHSRDRAVSGRRHGDSRAEDKEMDYVKRGSRWTYGDSRDEKEFEDREISNEKDVRGKSPRDRPDGATENRDIHSKKLKGFVSEKFTHGNSNAEEKHTSRFKPALGAGNQGLSLQSQSKEAEVSGDVDAAKVAAMQAAELVNKNLVGTGYLTTDQKKKLLWGKKKSTAAEEPAHRWDSALVGDRERQEKFNKLMGVKGSVVNKEQNLNEVQVEKQNELQKDLEKQYTAGLRRRDGRTVGLGL